MVYGPNSLAEDELTAGAENSDGTVGANYCVGTVGGNGASGRGTPPVAGDLLKVASAPEQRSSASFSFAARGRRIGSYTNTVEMPANTFAGVNIVTAPVQVVAP